METRVHGGFLGRLHQGFSAFGQRQPHGASVGGMGCAVHQLAFLKILQKNHHIGRQDIERLAQLARGSTWVVPN